MSCAQLSSAENYQNPSLIRAPSRWVWAALYLLIAVSAAQFLLQIPVLYQWPRMDFGAYYHAAYLVREGASSTIYSFAPVNLDALGYDRIISPYIYAPPVAVIMVPVTWLSFKTAQTIWFGLEILLLVHAVWLLLTYDPARPKLIKLVVLLFLLLILNYGSVIGELCVGNINMLLLWLAVAALRLTMRGRDALAGVLIGIGFAIKVTPIVLLTYFIVTRRRRAVVSFAGTAAGLILLTFLAVGPEPFTAFVHRFSELSQGTANSDNLSINGFLQRLLRSSEWTIAPFPYPELLLPLSRVLGLAVLGASTVGVWARRHDPLFCFSLMAVAIGLASPVTWACHLVSLLPAFFWMLERQREKLTVSSSPARLAPVLLFWAAMVGLVIMQTQNLILDPVQGLIPVLWISRATYGLAIFWVVMMVHAFCVSWSSRAENRTISGQYRGRSPLTPFYDAGRAAEWGQR